MVDVVWLKKDVRLHDHGPLWTASTSGRPFVVLYLYEPDQLRHHSMHGSHVNFQNEGLEEMDKVLKACAGSTTSGITFLRAEVTEALDLIHQQKTIVRLLAHQETGHLSSFGRDRRVRKWCKSHGVPFIEINQNGVTRCLRSRDEFTKGYNAYVRREEYASIDPQNIAKRLVTDLPSVGILRASELSSELEHPEDRQSRQRGGEREALRTLRSFLDKRGVGYNAGISKPAKSWRSCSRLSPYLTYGHISIRRVHQTIKRRQDELRAKRKRQPRGSKPDPWLRSLASFSSRMRWRSHFVQKLETEPQIEVHSTHPAYDRLRCEDGDFNPHYFEAWKTGRTGYPMVDACMRMLLKHGWLNFRMRAMLVSFAAYNLYLDWRKIAPHLARCFLDYERTFVVALVHVDTHVMLTTRPHTRSHRPLSGHSLSAASNAKRGDRHKRYACLFAHQTGSRP